MDVPAFPFARPVSAHGQIPNIKGPFKLTLLVWTATYTVHGRFSAKQYERFLVLAAELDEQIMDVLVSAADSCR